MKNDLTGKVCAASIAAMAALATAATPAFAASAAAPAAASSAHAGAGHGGMHRAAHVIAHARGVRNAGWGMWGYGPAVYGVPQSAAIEPAASVGALSQHVTYIYDVPWDAVHRYPPAAYEYAQGCHTQHQTVPRHGGGKQSIDIVRCY